MGRSMLRPSGWVLVGGLIIGRLVAAQSPPSPVALPEPQATGLASRPLLDEPTVQRDLRLTSAQRDRLANLDGEANQARQNLTEPGEEGFDFAAMLGQVQQVEQERSRAIGRILTPAQKNRLVQLEWQREGWPALARAEVATRLNLPPHQKERIGRVVERLRQDEARSVLLSGAAPDTATGRKLRADLKPSNGFIDPSGGGFADGGPLNFSTEGMAAQEQRQTEAVARLRRDAAREVDEILTAAQKSAFLDLLGPRFDWPALRPGAPAIGAELDRAERGTRAKSKK